MKDKTKSYLNFIIKSPYKFELFFWLAALIYLFAINPYSSGHLDLCLFQLYGIDTCPGCGLGKSISFIFHGDFMGSISSHPLGLFALALIFIRITALLIKTNSFIKTTRGVNYG